MVDGTIVGTQRGVTLVETLPESFRPRTEFWSAPDIRLKTNLFLFCFWLLLFFWGVRACVRACVCACVCVAVGSCLDRPARWPN